MKKKTESVTRLATEQANPAARDLDLKSSLDITRIINREDAKVARAVRRTLPEIAGAIDAIADALSRGGRLVYVGAGTSGRIAALDAAECPPTFGTDPAMIQYVIAGGAKALGSAVEANEDSQQFGRIEIAKKKPRKNDVIVGIAASGRTPFTLAAMQYARAQGAKTIAVVGNHGSPMAKAADIAIVVKVGPEVISGSSRMKAGTAQKMVLNMLTTGAMTRLGYVYGNLMINVQPKNEKLRQRALEILRRITGADPRKAKLALTSSGNNVPIALLMLEAGVTRKRAQQILASTSGNVRRALDLAARPL